MTKFKKAFILASIFILIGIGLFITVMTINNWDFTKIHSYTTTTHEVNENFNSISIDTSTADILFVPSDDGKNKIVCYEKENFNFAISIENDVLTIKNVDNRKWYDYILNVGTDKLTIYLSQNDYSSLLINTHTSKIEIPNNFNFTNVDITTSTGIVKCNASALEQIKIKTTTGNIQVENVTAEEIDLSVSTGKINITKSTCKGTLSVNVSTGKTYLTDVTCKTFNSKGSTGDAILKNVIVEKTLTIKRSTGDVKFDSCDANEIFVNTNTGNVTGTLLSEKTFIPKSDTGYISVPKTNNGGICEITTSTGDIKISIK